MPTVNYDLMLSMGEAKKQKRLTKKTNSQCLLVSCIEHGIYNQECTRERAFKYSQNKTDYEQPGEVLGGRMTTDCNSPCCEVETIPKTLIRYPVLVGCIVRPASSIFR